MLKRLGFFAFSAFFSLALPMLAHAATADLRVSPSDIRFSKPLPLIEGDTIRIYTKVQNIGTVDVTGYVTFYQGSSAIDQPQVISVVSGSDPEEVFVDFVVPSGTFNLRTVISGTKPADMNLDNNVAITTMLTPIKDDDRDGVPNASDNCPTASNANQLDTDHDGIGNACDDDMDADGLTNAVENELGTNPLLKDTDGDGIDDAHDAYPLDPKRWVLEKPTPPKVVVKPAQVIPEVKETKTEPYQAKTASVTGSNIQTGVSGSVAAPSGGTPNSVSDPSNSTSAEDTSVQVSTDASKIRVSPNAVFTYEKNAWNTFTFRLIAPVQDRFVYEWNFGDGVRSSKTSLSHTYAQAGEYHVTIKTTDDQGGVSEESADVTVTFFSLSNPLIIGLLILLGVILAGALITWFFPKTKKRPRKTDSETPIKQIHVQEE